MICNIQYKFIIYSFGNHINHAALYKKIWLIKFYFSAVIIKAKKNLNKKNIYFILGKYQILAKGQKIPKKENKGSNCPPPSQIFFNFNFLLFMFLTCASTCCTRNEKGRTYKSKREMVSVKIEKRMYLNSVSFQFRFKN